MCIFIAAMTVACDIESAIDDAGRRCDQAGQRCEDEIASIIQDIEDTCLTKDELIAIIDSVRTRNDDIVDCVAIDEGDRR